MGKQWQISFSWAPKSLQMVTAAMKLKDASSLEEKYDQTRQHIKKQRHCFANKGPSSQRYGFSSSHAWMWELDYKESWAPKNWFFWTVVLEKTLQSPLDWKEIQPVHAKANQSWLFIGRTDVEAETPILWPRLWRADSFEKTLMLGKIEGRRRRGRQRMRWLDGITDSVTWVWVNSGSWWWTGKPGVLQSMGSQRVGHEWVTEVNWTEAGWQYTALKYCFPILSQSIVPRPVLTAASSLAYRFLRRQVR